MSTVADTVSRFLSGTYEESAPRVAKPASETSTALRKLAQSLTPASDEPTLADLHAVKEAQEANSYWVFPEARPYLPTSDHPQAEGLRKIAHALRSQAVEVQKARLEKAAHVFSAMRGLMLLKTSLEAP